MKNYFFLSINYKTNSFEKSSLVISSKQCWQWLESCLIDTAVRPDQFKLDLNEIFLWDYPRSLSFLLWPCISSYPYEFICLLDLKQERNNLKQKITEQNSQRCGDVSLLYWQFNAENNSSITILVNWLVSRTIWVLVSIINKKS